MVISNLKLTNFRNYSRLDLELGPKMNVIIGKNAEGKTNILESICVLALTKTYKTGIEPNLISFDNIRCVPINKSIFPSLRSFNILFFCLVVVKRFNKAISTGKSSKRFNAVL